MHILSASSQGYMMSLCLTTGDIIIDHVDKVVSAPQIIISLL